MNEYKTLDNNLVIHHPNYLLPIALIVVDPFQITSGGGGRR